MSTDHEGVSESQAHKGNPVYEAKNPKTKVRCIYLYYLTPRASQHPEVQVFVWLLKPGQHIEYDEKRIKQLLTEIVQKVKSGSISAAGWSVTDVRWRCKGLIAAVLDGNDELIANDAMRFGHIEDPCRPGQICGGNETFRDGRDTTLPDLNGITAFYCLNHMKKHKEVPERDLKAESDHYCVSFGTKNHPHDEKEWLQRKDRSHNDSATNTGPPHQ